MAYNSELTISYEADGSVTFSNTTPLPETPPSCVHWLFDWAARTPDRSFLIERHHGADRPISYARAAKDVAAIASALLMRGLGPDRPLLICARNSIAVAEVQLAAMMIGAPVANISVGYARGEAPFRRLAHALELIDPAMIYLEDDPAMSAAADALQSAGRMFFQGEAEVDSMRLAVPTEAARLRFEALDADGVAKIMLTSGSTGAPKGVIIPHGMLTSNAAAYLSMMPDLRGDDGFKQVCWLPWSHAMAGNSTFTLNLALGGTMVIDDGGPDPQGIERSLAAIAAHRPSFIWNVPVFYAALAQRITNDPRASAAFYANMQVMMYAGAAISEPVYETLARAGQKKGERQIPFFTAYGTTETGPIATCCTSIAHQGVGRVGIPVPQSHLRLVPRDGKYEAYLKGPNITPGYWRDAASTASSFDERRYWKSGDALALVDPAHPERGLRFDGRLVENFKLATGTWVNVGAVRSSIVSTLAPLALDCVIAGEGRKELGALVFLDQSACARTLQETDISLLELARDSRIHALIKGRLEALGRSVRGSSERVARMLLLDRPPSLEAGETTEKGYLNQRLILRRRAAEVQRLFGSADPALVVLDTSLGGMQVR